MHKKLSKKAALQIHCKLNPKEIELRKIQTANYRAKRASIDPQFITYEEWIDLLKKYNFSCVKCNQQEPRVVLVMDHVIPISKGGSSGINNIQPLCQSCNVSKGNKTTDYRLEFQV